MQGFPDNYTFHSEDGSVKTVSNLFPAPQLLTKLFQLHRQIGNAVAWPVSRAIGQQFAYVLLLQRNPKQRFSIDTI